MRVRPKSEDSATAKRSGGWILTYSDMITLLMAFFLGIIAFYARRPAHGASEDTSVRMSRSIAEQPLPASHAVRLPVSLLFDEDNRLSRSGSQLLSVIAGRVRSLPCELHFQVEKSSSIPRAVDACSYLILQEGFLPARLAVGSHPPADGVDEAIWLVLVRHG